MCFRVFDIGIVMDRCSRSKGEFIDWMDIMKFVGNLIYGKFEIFYDMMYIGVIVFNEFVVEVFFDFD